jgi:hypothetical protein
MSRANLADHRPSKPFDSWQSVKPLAVYWMNRKSSPLNDHRHFSAFAGTPDGWRSFQQAVDLLEAGI